MSDNAGEHDQLNLGADTPKRDPAEDAFGYSAFAKRIADAIRRTPSPQGLVMAVHGSWGTGKSTLLNFAKHYLAELDAESITIIEFNPWWFNDKDQLATQFLDQFRAQLPHESELLRDLGDKMADYSDAIGTTVAAGSGHLWAAKPVSFGLKFFKRKPKDVPKLKKEIAEALSKINRRFLFIIDDIDRLTPDEIRELLKVIKALADFPNVVYLLSFDRAVVARSLQTSLGVDGEAYLEKIVQVPFSLPSIDPLRLRQKFIDDLNELFAQLPPLHFDQEYWSEVFTDGLEHFIDKPRSVVRIVNAMTVTYPAVVGEVNPVDFIALEFLRVFEPAVYSTISGNKEMFVKPRLWEDAHKQLRAFHDAWLERVPEIRRKAMRDLVSHLFPLVGGAWSNVNHGAEFRATWRKELRVASADVFDVYFQFGVSPDALSRSELDQLIAAGTDSQAAIAILTKAATIIRSTGHTKARDYFERLRDLQEDIAPDSAKGLLGAMFAVGDRLLTSADEGGGFMSLPNRWRYRALVLQLLDRVPESERASKLFVLAKEGKAVALMVDLVASIESNLEKGEPEQFTSTIADELKAIVTGHLENLAEKDLLDVPDMAYIMHYWKKWGGEAIIRKKAGSLFASDEQLPFVLEKFARFGIVSGGGRRGAQRTFILNPREIEYIIDINALEPRVDKMLKRADLTTDQRGVGEAYMRNMERIKNGQDPDYNF